MFRESIIYTIEKALPKLISVIFLPIILRLISPELWAEIVLLLGLQLFFSLMLTFGNERAIFKFSENVDNFNVFIKNLIKYFLFGFVIIELFGQFFENLPFSLIYGLPIRFMLLSTFFITLNRLLINRMRVLKKPKIVLISSVFDSFGTPLIQTLLIFFVVEIDGYRTRVIVTVFFLVQLIFAFIKTVYLNRSLGILTFSILKNIRQKLPKEITQFSNINFYVIISGYFINWQDKFIVEYFFDYEYLGIYGLTTRVANLIFVIISGLVVSGLANYWPEKHQGNNQSYIKYNSIVLNILGFISLGIICLYTSLGKLLVPSSYFESIELIFFGCLATAFKSLITIFTVQQGAKDELSKILKINIFVLILQILLFLTVPIYNMNQIFFIQIISFSLGILVFFKKDILRYYKEFIVLSLNFFLIYQILAQNFSVENIILFLFGSVYVFIGFRSWIKINK